MSANNEASFGDSSVIDGFPDLIIARLVARRSLSRGSQLLNKMNSRQNRIAGSTGIAAPVRCKLLHGLLG